MVQRELGERLFAVPSTKAYAAVSVLTQLACRIDRVRPVPASAFRPQPRVESSFLTFVRRDAALEEAGAGVAAGSGTVAAGGSEAAAGAPARRSTPPCRASCAWPSGSAARRS